MKIIRVIGYKQTFDVDKFNWIGKCVGQEKAWVIRGVHYFYAEENEDKESVYTKIYQPKQKIVSGVLSCYDASENIDLLRIAELGEKCIHNVETSIMEIDYESTQTTAEQLYRDMEATQYKEWWHSVN